MNTNRIKAPVVIAVLALAACSEAPKPSTTAATTEPAKEAGPPQPITAKTAYWEMYKLAHSWAADMMPISLASKEIPGYKNEDGKAAMWVGTFASPGKREYRVFTYAIVSQDPDIHKGVSVGNSIPWGGPTREVMPFTSSDFAVDSDEAYKAAHEKAEAFLKKYPDKKVTLTLGYGSAFPAPVWYVLWGDKKLGFFQVVNATSGKPLSGK